MIDVVSTNKTDFYREKQHFDYMTKVILPAYSKTGITKDFSIWSSASSSGEEIYTAAIIMEEYNTTIAQKINYNILGTDVSVEKVSQAINAVYHKETMAVVPRSIQEY